MSRYGRIPEQLRGESNKTIRFFLRKANAPNTKAAKASRWRRGAKLGYRHAPVEPTVVDGVKMQPQRHWSQPVWWERVKGADGRWTATPHYGTPIRKAGAGHPHVGGEL